MKVTPLTKTILIGTAIASLALLVIVIQNLASAQVELLLWNVGAPLSLLVIGAYVLGALTARPLARLIQRVWRSQTIVLGMSDRNEAAAD